MIRPYKNINYMKVYKRIMDEAKDLPSILHLYYGRIEKTFMPVV